MTSLRRHRGRGQTSRSGTHHRDVLHLRGWDVVQLGFVAGTRVDQAGGQFAAEGMVEAGLVAADAGIDGFAATSGGLVDEFRIGQERTRHRHHVGIALGQDLFSHFRGVDAVGGDQRNAHLTPQLGGYLGKGGARDLGGDRRDPRLVPADARVDQGRTGALDGLGQQHDLIPGAAALDEIEHGKPIDDDEIAPHRFAHPADDLDRKAHPVLVATTPAVRAVVGVRYQELIDEVAFRPHDLNAVVPRLLRQARTVDEVADLLLDARLVQFTRREGVDGRLDRARRHQLRAIGIAPCVQDLHADFAAGFMDRLGDDPVFVRLFRCRELGRTGAHGALLVGSNAPVTIKPTPPRARSAKNAAMRSKPSGISSRPVCIEPIRVRLRNVVKPRSSGASRWGKAVMVDPRFRRHEACAGAQRSWSRLSGCDPDAATINRQHDRLNDRNAQLSDRSAHYHLAPMPHLTTLRPSVTPMPTCQRTANSSPSP